MNDFEYQPLDTALGQIRLVHLQKPKGSSNTEIRYTLQHASLGKAPEYEPLSYTWGSAQDRVPICVDGKAMLVTRSLQDALWQLSTEIVSSQLRTLWVDAICINQVDDAEKSLQVQQMGSIYKSASRVVIWLGKESLSSGVAMRHLHFLGIVINGIQHVSISQWTNPSTVHPKFRDYSAWHGVIKSFMRKISKSEAPFTPEVMTAIEDLAKRP
jgi:Heterokaryon incompatibility protein (HET)